MPEKMLTASEAAKALGMAVKTIHRWDASGRLVAQRKTPTSRRLYTQKQIEEFILRGDDLAHNVLEEDFKE